MSVELRHGGRLHCMMVRGCFEVDGWESCCLVKVKTGESKAVKRVVGSMILVQAGWHYVCGQQKGDE